MDTVSIGYSTMLVLQEVEHLHQKIVDFNQVAMRFAHLLQHLVVNTAKVGIGGKFATDILQPQLSDLSLSFAQLYHELVVLVLHGYTL